jgi:GNAT superfamily N-acetyltransferase
MDQVRVRPASSGDGQGVARCWTDAGEYYEDLEPATFQVPDTPGLAGWFEQLLSAPRPDDELWLVAETGGEAVGFVTARLLPPDADATRQLVRDLGQVRVVVDALVVDARYRRRGIGTRLLGSVEEWARTRGAALLLLDTYAASPLSVPFYERRMGYARRSVRFQKALGQPSPHGCR